MEPFWIPDGDSVQKAYLEEYFLKYHRIVQGVKTKPDVTLARHMVDVQKAVAEFREASERDTRYIFSGVPLRQQRA